MTKKGTTFRTSKGTIVNIAAPSVYVSPAFISSDDVTNPTEMINSVGTALDIHSTFQLESFHDQGIDAHFMGRGGLVGGSSEKVTASNFWVRTPGTLEGTFTLPANRTVVSLYSRRAFKFPQLTAYFKLPNLMLVGNEIIIRYYWGVETGANALNSVLSFNLLTTAAINNQLQVTAGPYTTISVNIDINKPANALTVDHRYQVLHSKNLTIFSIDHAPVCFAVPSATGVTIKVKENVLPYSIVLAAPMASSITALHELYTSGRTAIASADVVVAMSPLIYRLQDGNEIIPLQLPLYKEDTSTLFAGLAIAVGSQTSHPFPIFGYQEKAINFRANQQGTLSVEVLKKTNNWREYDTMGITQNKVKTYSIEGEGVLARVVFTPNTYPCTISEAEVVLR